MENSPFVESVAQKRNNLSHLNREIIEREHLKFA